MAVISISRDTNNNVSLVRMEVSVNLATVAGAGWVASVQDEIDVLNGGVWSWFMTDMVLVSASDGNAFFYFKDPLFQTLTIYGEQGSGTVNPALANSIAYYATSGSSISGLAVLANAILATNGSGVPALTQTLPGAVQGNISSVGTITLGTWHGSPVAVPYGGTGDTSFTAYAVICGGTTSTGALQSVASVGTAGDILISNGPGMLPTFQSGIASGTINTGNVNDLPYYSTNPSGKTLSAIPGAVNSVLVTSGLGVPSLSQTLPSAVQGNITALGTIATGVWHGTAIGEIYGGTNQTAYTLGDTLYASAANTLSRLAGNTTAVKQYLSQTGTGAVSAAPAWATISGGDIAGAALTKTDDTNVTLTLGGTPATALLRAASITAGWTGQLSLARGGTNASLTASAGAVPYSTASAIALSAVGSSGQLFQSTGTTAPGWTTATYPATAGTSGHVLTSDGTNWTSAAPATSGTVTSIATNNGVTGGTITSSGTIGLASIADHTLLANISGGATFPSSTTLTALIDNAIGSTQGNILYRNATVWTVLAPSTSGLPLLTKGAGANPAFDVVPVTGGGTGVTGIDQYKLLAGSSATQIQTLVSTGSQDQVLISNGPSALPTWGTVPVDGGGTGVNTITAYAVICGGTTSTGHIQTVATVGSAGQLLTSAGAGALPTWTTPTYPSASGSAGKILRSDGTNNVYSTATYPDTASTSGNVLTSDGTNFVSSAGPFTTQSVVTGSRALGGVYHNTTGRTMFVSVSVTNTGGGVGTTQAFTDSNASPSTIVAQSSNPPNATAPGVSMTFMVLNGNYYKIGTNVSQLDYWTEWY